MKTSTLKQAGYNRTTRRAWSLLALFLLATTALVKADDFTYSTNGNNVTITGYTGTSSVVSIPATNSDGKAIARIGDNAFISRTNLTSVTIGPNVTDIGSAAFFSCTDLSSLTIGASVTNIGDYSFSDCGSLTNVTFPTSVTNIGEGAFSGCGSLTDVLIPNSVINIGSEAFRACAALSTVTIPESVASIGDKAFYDCDGLTAFTVDEDNSVYSSLAGVLFNESQTTLIQYPSGNGANYTVPDGVTGVGESAFHNCGSLTNITIPDSVTSIGSNAFNSCFSLVSVTGGSNIISIASHSFYSCWSLTAITLGTNVTSIGDYAFSVCQSLAAITIPASVISIGDYAFSVCESLTAITIPASVISIGNNAFNQSYQMTNITVDAANSVYSSLDGVLFNEDQTTLIRCPEAKGGIYVVPDTVTSIADNAFFECKSQTRITVPGSVTSIVNYAFQRCNSLKAMYFLGNAPSVATNELFFQSPNVIVYYLPGTTGWGATLGLRDTVLWDPQVQSDDAGFGVQTNKFGFNITGNTGLVIVVVASTNLAADAAWTPMATNSLAAGGLSYFSDPQWTNYPWRYYRLRSP